ncbi:tyrosine-type recombinase/integrase [Streptosporangium sp. NBC_01469]|uniref:tyrosine-type recombinase/integrase n=2 Tax=unclassified Streptosporangium TaxID=2632669 RepID=UPI002E2A81B5|nr:tyrosine-type recombinase/integrase [Streptosporangium sp. NBC_01469]
MVIYDGHIVPTGQQALDGLVTPADGSTGHTAADYTLSAAARTRIADGVPANTRRAYERQWAAFALWCTNHGRLSLPATGHTLAEYVETLCAADQAPASIEQALACVRTMHRLAGHTNQPPTDAARLALRAYKRARAEAGTRGQREAPPVSIDALRAMVSACDLRTRIGVRDRLLLVLGLALMGRRSELVALTCEDIREVHDGLEVTIRTSKTDKDSHGETIAIPRGSHPLTDPVAAWADWIAVLTDAEAASGRLLRRIDRHGNLGSRLGADAVNVIIRALAIRAGVPSAETFTAHSLRAGGATVAYAAGVPVSVIAKHGRWAPTSPVVLRYIRAVDRWRDNAMRNVGL